MPRYNKQIVRIVRRAEKIAKEFGIDPSVVDFFSIIDNTLTPQENMKKILQELLMLIPDEEKRIEFKEKYLKEKIKDSIKKAYEQYSEELDNISEEIRERYYNTLEKLRNTTIYAEYNKLYGKRVERVFKSKRTHLLIVHGAGGVGKSTFIEQKAIEYFGKNGVLKIKGFFTEKGLFIMLRRLAEKEKGILIIDNAEETVFTNNFIRALLEQATEKEPEREVFRITGEVLEDRGTSSVILREGHKIAIITNHYRDDDPKLQALKTRAVVIHFNAKHSHMFGEKLLTEKIGKEYAEKIKTTLSALNVYHMLTLRDFIDIIDMFETYNNIEDVITECKLTFFEKNAYLKAAYQVYMNHQNAPYGKSAIEEWVATTGLSGRTYKNYIRTLRNLGIIKYQIDKERDILNSEELFGKDVGT